MRDEENAYVPSAGPKDADIVIVGEAPGYQEALVGVPFTGPSGRLLDLVLAEHNIRREDVFFTNACLCRPPGNATPPAKAVQCCYPRLKGEIDGVSPTRVVTLGNVASQALLETKIGITTLRSGPPKTSALYPDIHIIPTVHPAACLRSSDMFPSLVTDIGKLNGHVAVKWEAPTFVAYEDPRRASGALRELFDRRGPITVDIEVGFEKDTEFDHPDHYKMLCVGIGYAPGRAVVIGEMACGDPMVGDLLGRVLRDKQVICHNGKFDLAGLRRYTKRSKLFFDTMLASYCVDERPGTHGLKYLAKEILGAPPYDLELKGWTQGGNFDRAPRELLYTYNAYDAVCTYDLYNYYRDRLEREDLRNLHDFLCRASDALQPSEVEGVGVNLAYTSEVETASLEVLEGLRSDLNEMVGYPINPNSPKQVKEYFETQGINVPTTNKEMLQALIDQGRATQFCEGLLKHRQEGKFYGTYVKGIRKRTIRGRVHPTFMLHGTVTGRLSCRNPNLQNIPRGSKARRLFVPEAGRVFVEGDYAQAELRVVAALAEDSYLRGVFSEGRNIHAEVAEMFYGPRWTKEHYVRAKAYVFGLTYGREAASIAAEYKIPYAEAQRHMNTFFDVIPDVVRWRQEQQNMVMEANEDLISPFGRHRRFWLITKDNRKDILKECLAFKPQSTASDICLSALIKLRELGLHVRIPVHDSILVECYPAEAQDVARLMKTVMEQTAIDTFTDYVPFPVDIAIGPTWGDLT